MSSLEQLPFSRTALELDNAGDPELADVVKRRRLFYGECRWEGRDSNSKVVSNWIFIAKVLILD